MQNGDEGLPSIIFAGRGLLVNMLLTLFLSANFVRYLKSKVTRSDRCSELFLEGFDMIKTSGYSPPPCIMLPTEGERRSIGEYPIGIGVSVGGNAISIIVSGQIFT